MSKFTHLHVHTEYSLLDGSNKIKEMVKKAKDLGMDSLAITDHGVMYGVIDFYKEAKAAGLKPIIGCEIYVAPGSRFDKGGDRSESKYNHLILLAENNEGYKNLMKIVSIGFTEGFYYKPRVDYEILQKYHEGIIATSACLAGEVQRFLANGMYEEGKAAALRLNDIFGEGNFFLELQDHGLAAQKYVNKQLIDLSKETGIELICSNDVHYTNAEDAEAHDVLLCVQTNSTITDENRMRYEGGQFYFKSQDEMQELFSYVPEAIYNTQKIADRCNVEIEFGKTKLPRYDFPKEYSSAGQYLTDLCKKGLKERYPEAAEDEAKNLQERLATELGVISSMGYVEYFLIVWDFVKFAREHNIAVGPGRGSASGSLVSYCLKITDIDPIKNDLVFERFLNPERVSMPDIDIDFCYERRGEVIDYVINKYGKDCVSQIITFGTMKARAAIKDVGRAMNIPYSKRDEISKMIPARLDITISKALNESEDLRKLYESDVEVRDLIEKSIKLEGLPRHASVHAAGVLICDKPVYEYVPIAVSSDNTIISQFVMTTLEELGLLKMDFLALRTLTVIRDTVDMIRRRDKDFDIEKIPLDDKKVYDYISTGRCEGIFQLESSGMKSFMKRLKPESLDDLIAGIALYRPGPMEFIPKYIESKNNADKITYECDELKPILASTYGCMVYQEQVMQIVRDLAGYSWGRSDLVRRAMSKKKADVMEKERQNFIYGNPKEGIKGCVNNGIDEKIAGKIFDEMTEFANYAFNKAHAAGYAVISYRTAYLKTHYKSEYMAAIMTSVMDQAKKINEYSFACEQENIKVLPPDINESEERFTERNGSIRFALSEIKGLGWPAAKAIVAERKQNGEFKSLSDLVNRLHGKIGKKTIETLIKAGTMDGLAGTRRGKVSILDKMVDEAVKKKKDSCDGQISFIDLMAGNKENDGAVDNYFSIDVPEMEEYSLNERLEFEKEYIGVYVSGHPLDEYKDIINKNITARAEDFAAEEENDEETPEAGGGFLEEKKRLRSGASEIIAGSIVSVKEILTKKMDTMGFLTLEDTTGEIELVVFPKQYAKYRRLFIKGGRVFVRGEVSEDDRGAKLIVSEMYDMDEVRDKNISLKPEDKLAIHKENSIEKYKDRPSNREEKKIFIRFNTKEEFLKRKERLLKIVGKESGNDALFVYSADIKKYMKLSDKAACTEDLLENFKKEFGKENIVIKGE